MISNGGRRKEENSSNREDRKVFRRRSGFSGTPPKRTAGIHTSLLKANMVNISLIRGQSEEKDRMTVPAQGFDEELELYWICNSIKRKMGEELS